MKSATERINSLERHTQKSISKLPALPNSLSPTWKVTVILSSTCSISWKHSLPCAASWILCARAAPSRLLAVSRTEGLEKRILGLLKANCAVATKKMAVLWLVCCSKRRYSALGRASTSQLSMRKGETKTTLLFASGRALGVYSYRTSRHMILRGRTQSVLLTTSRNPILPTITTR